MPSGGTTGASMGGNSGLDAHAGGTGGLGGLPGNGGAPGTGGVAPSGGTTATGGIQATGGITASSGTSNVGGTQATGGIGSTGGIMGTGGVTTHDAAADVSQLINEAGNPICGDTLCGTAQYCCNSPCHQCMPSPDTCSLLVCGTADGGPSIPTLPTALLAIPAIPPSAGRPPRHPIPSTSTSVRPACWPCPVASCRLAQLAAPSAVQERRTEAHGKIRMESITGKQLTLTCGPGIAPTCTPRLPLLQFFEQRLGLGQFGIFL